MEINLISDTVTKPSAEMLKAMFKAKVGDDVFKQDPTINEFEQIVAELFGKEAALFFESGSAAGIDYIIGVYAPQHLRIQRVMQRDNISREEVLSRLNKQINEEMKMKLCDFVVVNDEQHLLLPQVIALHEKFIQLST